MTIESTSADNTMRTECLSADAAIAPVVAVPEVPRNVDVGRREILPGYRLLEPIGAGGYGTVWRAEAPGGLAKAIKIVHGQFDEKRAADEWKALRHVRDVRHPFLLSLERIEVVDQQLIVVTELADGSLKDCFEKHRNAGRPGIPRDELLGYLAEAADALDYMSTEHGLQHLDVKPENLLLVGTHVKVADFGLVKNIHGSSISMIAGLTPMFSAPETFDGRPTDRSDQYSLAVVYQFLLCGKCPFQGQTFAQLASQHLHGRPDVGSLPEYDRQVVERALAKDPFDRFASCRALVERLRGTTTIAPRSTRAPERPASASNNPQDTGAEFHTEVIDAGAEVKPKTKTDTEIGRPCVSVTDLPPLTLDDHRLQPTLFIGLGNCGIKALAALHDRLCLRYGSLADIPSIHLLAIDTDDASRVTARAFNCSEDEDSFLYVPLKPTQYYRKQADDLTRWLNRRWIYNIPKSLKTEGIRPLGRLAMVDHMPRIEQRVREACARIIQPQALTATSATTGQSVDQQSLRVIIVGSISSGTGGGMVWDMVQLAHQVLPRDIKGEIVCVLGHWTTISPKEVELATANACAALVELHHYMTEGCPGDPSIHLPALGRHHGLFDNVYIVNLGSHDNPESFDAAASELGSYLDANLECTSANFVRTCRRGDDKTQRSNSGLRSFSLTRISDSDLAALEQVAWQLVDPNAPPERRLANARRRALDQFLTQRVAALTSNELTNSGARRFFIATSLELQKAGFLSLVQQHLPATATAATQNDEGIMILCEFQNLTPANVAWSIAQNRAELFALGSRLVTRGDVAWLPLME